MTDPSKNLGTAPVGTLLRQLSLPAICGMLSGAVFNVVDRMFLGHVSHEALAAVGITMPVQILQMAFLLLVGNGAATLISIKLGCKEQAEAETLLALGLKLVTLFLFLFALFFALFHDALYALLRVSPAVLPMAESYIEIIVYGGVLSLPGFALNSVLRALGRGNVSMRVILYSSVLNVILDPIFIFVFDWGVPGAAVATVVSQIFLTVYVSVYLWRSRDLPIRLCPSCLRRKGSPHLTSQLLKAGAPAFYVQILGTLVSAYINWQVMAYGSDEALGALTIAATVFGFYHMIVFGIVQGNQPICGFNWGAERYDRVLRSLDLSLVASFLFSLAIFVVVMLFPDAILYAFSDSTAFRAESSTVLRLYLCMIPLVGVQTIAAQYYQSVGKPRLASILSLLRYGVILVPLVMLLTPQFGVLGVYLGYALSDFFASLVAIVCILRERRMLREKAWGANMGL